MWLKADSALVIEADASAAEVGDPVMTWTEEAGSLGSTLDFTQTSDPLKRPSLISEAIGSGPAQFALLFDGVTDGGDILSTASSISHTEFGTDNTGAILVVARSSGLQISSSQQGQTPFAWGGGNDRLNVQTEFSVTPGVAAPDVMHMQYGNPSSGGDAAANFNFGDGTWRILTVWRDGNTPHVRVGGVVLAASPNFTDTLSGAPTAVADVGGSVSNDRWNGAIAEILTFNTADQNTIDLAELYLGNKYGLAAVPEPSEYAMIFGVVCVLAAVVRRYRRQQPSAA
jgi:hypothetical protein